MVDYWHPEDAKPQGYRAELESVRMGIVVLRAFGAGKSLTSGYTPKDLYLARADDPLVSGIVVGTSSVRHAADLMVL